jgi:hypothetical protein
MGPHHTQRPSGAQQIAQTVSPSPCSALAPTLGGERGQGRAAQGDGAQDRCAQDLAPIHKHCGQRRWGQRWSISAIGGTPRAGDPVSRGATFGLSLLGLHHRGPPGADGRRRRAAEGAGVLLRHRRGRQRGVGAVRAPRATANQAEPEGGARTCCCSALRAMV